MKKLPVNENKQFSNLKKAEGKKQKIQNKSEDNSIEIKLSQSKIADKMKLKQIKLNQPKQLEISQKKQIDFKSKNIKQKKKIKILYAASESQPFIATGGLADVAGSLPNSIAAMDENVDIRVVIPLYLNISEQFRKNFEFVTHFYVQLSWRKQYCGIFKYRYKNITYYFIDNETYFKRSGVYDYLDDGERFAFFSRAVVEMLPKINFFPDIIHTNDWQLALVPAYIKLDFSNDKRYKNIKFIHTIHNIEYQGKFGVETIEDLFGVDKKYLGDFAHDSCLNLTKAAIKYCDRFTTVSNSYAEEIKGALASHGLNNVIVAHQNKLSGILNGIDYEFQNPLTDENIYKNYSFDSWQDKYENKIRLQAELGLPVNKDIPIFCMVCRLVAHKGLDLVEGIIEEVLKNDVQFLIVGGGEQRYVDYFKNLQSKYPAKVRAYVGSYSRPWGQKFYAGSDILIVPSLNEPCGISQMIASRFGTVPIVREVGGLKDTIKDFGCIEGGNGYTFSNYNPSDLLYTIRRAVVDYKDKAKWAEKIAIIMNRDFSWKASAARYINLYRELV